MNQLVVSSVLLVFSLTFSVNCTPSFYSKRVSSTSLGDGYTNTITEIDDNGRKEVFRNRKPGIPEQLDVGFDNSIGHRRIPDLNDRFNSPSSFDNDFRNNDFNWNSINRDPIKLQMPDVESKFPSIGELNSRFNNVDDPFSNGFISQPRYVSPDPIPTFNEPLRDFRGNDIGSDQYSIHKKGFSSSINVDGHKQEKAGATTTINDNGRTATYSVGDRPDVGPDGANYF